MCAAVTHPEIIILDDVWVELVHRAHHLDGDARVLAEEMQRRVGSPLQTKSARCL